MKLRDCYPSLQETAVVKAMVSCSVASMALENQPVFQARLEASYAQTAPALFLHP